MPALRTIACVAAALMLPACATTTRTPPAGTDRSSAVSLPSLDPARERGHDIAVRRCAGCHAVGLDDGDARDGPAFYKLARRYNALQLERRFAEVSEHGFDRMPSIALTHADAEDLIAYFDSLHGG